MRLLLKQRVFSWTDTYDVYDEYGNSIGTVERWTLTQLGGRLIFDEDLTSFTLSLNDLEGK